jgi:hypothetical protein
MPLAALLKLRETVGAVIDRRVTALRKELRSLGEDYKEVGRIAIYGKKKVKARKRRRKTGRPVGRPPNNPVGRPPNKTSAKRSAKKRKA